MNPLLPAPLPSSIITAFHPITDSESRLKYVCQSCLKYGSFSLIVVAYYYCHLIIHFTIILVLIDIFHPSPCRREIRVEVVPSQVNAHVRLSLSTTAHTLHLVEPRMLALETLIHAFTAVFD
jgi:hypothetical protein